MSFGQLFRKINRWGLPVDTVKRLLAKSYETVVVDDVVERARADLPRRSRRATSKELGCSSSSIERVITRRECWGCTDGWPWPVVAYMDTEMVDLMTGLPYEHVHHRRMQYDLLKRRFPALARLPLDRNAFNMKPVTSRYGRVVNHALFKPRELYYRWTRRLVERRFYYRTMAFDSPGWNAIRAAAEPHRGNAQRILDAAVLAEVLPGPGERFSVADGIIDASKMKLLIGLPALVRALPVGAQSAARATARDDRASTLAKEDSARSQEPIGRDFANRQQLARLSIDLHAAAWPAGLRGDRLTMRKPLRVLARQ